MFKHIFLKIQFAAISLRLSVNVHVYEVRLSEINMYSPQGYNLYFFQLGFLQFSKKSNNIIIH